MADGTFAWAAENVFRLKAADRLAAYRIVLCGKYSSTLRKVRWRVPHAVAGNSPSPHSACCLFLISLDTFLFYKLFH